MGGGRGGNRAMRAGKTENIPVAGTSILGMVGLRLEAFASAMVCMSTSSLSWLETGDRWKIVGTLTPSHVHTFTRAESLTC